jgi:ribonuclease P protein component
VTFVPGDADSPPRVAYAVGRRAGGAVERNRIRRRLRAAVAAAEADLEPGAYLVGATEEAASLSPVALHRAVSEAARDATMRRQP